MDEPVVTAAPPPARARNLTQQETDFTSEGSPPPGVVGPVSSMPPVEMASDHVRRKAVLPVTVAEAAARDATLAAGQKARDARHREHEEQRAAHHGRHGKAPVRSV